MITYEEIAITLIYIIVLYIVLKLIYRAIKENHQLKYKNMSISKLQKEIRKRIEKANKKNKK